MLREELSFMVQFLILHLLFAIVGVSRLKFSRWLPQRLKSRATTGEGNGVYGKVSFDREGVTLADQYPDRQPFPNLYYHGMWSIRDASSYGPW
jgi:hypothetical protein